jgi:hypothetical protein
VAQRGVAKRRRALGDVTNRLLPAPSCPPASDTSSGRGSSSSSYAVCAPPPSPPFRTRPLLARFSPASRPLLARFSLLMPAPQRQAAASPPSSSSSMRSSSSSSYAACFGSVPRRPPARFVPQRVAIPHRMDAQSTHSFVTSCSLLCRQAAACRTPSINGTSMSAAPGADPPVPPLLCRAEPALRIRMPLHR